jgi:hypothetical protein
MDIIRCDLLIHRLSMRVVRIKKEIRKDSFLDHE